MEVSSVIDGINARKKALNLNNQQISDMSGVPKSTVDRVLRKDTENPTMKVILDIAGAVGYEFGAPAVAQTPDLLKESPPIWQIISIYEDRIADLKRSHNRESAEKNRWITILAVTVGILAAGIIAILLIDILNPTVGWFQREMVYGRGSSTPVYDAFLAIRDWLAAL